MPQIEVTFDIDANGIVSVSAKDLGTGASQQVTITGGSALSQEEIDRMVGDAESHANEDQERRDQADSRNQADHATYSIEKQLAEHGDKLDDDEKTTIEDKITDLRKLLADDDAAASLKGATEALLTASQVLGQKIYEASQAEAASSEGDDNSGGGDDVVEAEIVEEEDES